jgi:hypothetical protein
MNEDELLDALKKGAVVKVSDSGGIAILALDDLSPKARECFRASREHDHQHLWRCPECLTSEAEATRMDTASHREDGNEAIALDLDAEAEKLRSRAEMIREQDEPTVTRPLSD